MSVKSLFKYPGTASVALRDGQYPGVKTRWFRSIAAFDKFFNEDADKPGTGYIVVDAQVVPYFFGLFVGVSAMYTNQLSADELEDMNMVSREVEFKMADIRAARAAQREQAAAVQKATEEELKRLSQVGAKYEASVKHMRSLSPSDQERKDIERTLNSGDPEILFADKREAFNAGYLRGKEVAK